MRQNVTTALELAGLLLIAAAVFLSLIKISAAGAAGAAGVVLIAESALLSWRPQSRRREVDVA